MKKRWLVMGSLTAVIAPIAAIVSCGTNVVGGVAFEKSSNTLNFNFNVVNPKFAPYFADGKITAEALNKLATDIEKAMTTNNVLKTKLKQEMTLKTTISFTRKIKKTAKELQNTTKTYKFTQVIKFTLKDLTNDDLRKSPFGFKNNILLALLNGLAQAGILANGSGAAITAVSEQDVVDMITGSPVKTFKLLPGPDASSTAGKSNSSGWDTIIKAIDDKASIVEQTIK